MKRLAALAIILGGVSPSAAQVALPDFLAPARKCVIEAARKYAALDASLGDVADAAIASCQPELDAFRPPKEKWTKPDDMLQAMDRFEGRLRSEALTAAADARLAK